VTFPERFNLADYYLDDRVREGRGDRPAILYRDETWTYADVQAAANRMANVLREVGVEVEDRVLIVLPDCPLFAATLFAVLKLGAVVTMVNPDLPLDDYYYYLNYTRARAVVCDAALAPLLGALGARYLRTVVARGGGLEAAMAHAPATFENEPTSPDDIAVWLFTSGSTGKPKGAVHMHHDFAYSTETYARQVLGVREDDVTLSIPKLFFGYATGTNLLFPFAAGARTVLYEEKSTPERMFDLIERYRPTILTSVPTMIGKMLAVPGAADRRLDGLRVTISAGEALPEELYLRWTRTFASEILDGIGSAELFHIYISNRFGEVRPGTLGRVVPGYEAKIVDDDGNPLPPGEIGTLWVKGDSAALCYFQAHEKSKEVLRGDWVVSGDKFSVDADGYFHYAGRTDDLLKVGGIFVAPVEVEAVLMQHPGVLKLGWQACEAFATELLALARSKLVHYKIPRKIEFCDALPRSDRGKIVRREVK